MEPVVPMPAPSRARPQKPKQDVKVLSSEMTTTQQGIHLIELLEYKGHKLKLHIESDAYKFQSKAVVTIFHPTDLKWNGLVSIPYGLMKTEEGLCYMPQAYGPFKNIESLRPKFMSDRMTLIDKMKLIL